MLKKTKEVREAVIGAARISDDGRQQLPCATAFALRDRHGMTLKEIGEISDQESIRIVACQLGCFR